jgi:hypothetical protein
VTMVREEDEDEEQRVEHEHQVRSGELSFTTPLVR